MERSNWAVYSKKYDELRAFAKRENKNEINLNWNTYYITGCEKNFLFLQTIQNESSAVSPARKAGFQIRILWS